MRRLGCVLALLVLAGTACAYDYIHLTNGAFTTVTLQPGEVKYFVYSTSNLGSSCVGSVCFQGETGDRVFKVAAHTQYAHVQLTLSQDTPLETANDTLTASGVNVGLLQKYGVWSNLYGGECVMQKSTWTPAKPSNAMYMAVKILDNQTKPLSVAIMAESHDTRVPVPGGCTTEGDYLYNPMLSLQYDAVATTVTFSQADMGITRDVCTTQCPSSNCCGEHTCNCDFLTNNDQIGQGTLKYEVYRSFVASCGSDFHRVVDERDVLSALASMSTVQGLLKAGHKVRDLLPSEGKVLKFDSLQGQGVIYNVLVTDTFQAAANPTVPRSAFQSVYVPVHTYACDVSSGECQKRDNFRMALCIIVAIIGLWLSVTGLLYFRITIGVFGFLFWSTIGYIVLGALTSLSWMSLVLYGSAIGLAMALLSYGGMWLFDTIGLALVLLGGCMGILLSGLIFSTPLTDMAIFHNNFNYGMAFACSVIIFPVLLLLNSRLITILSSSVVGSYCLLIGFDFFIGSEFNDIYANLLRRGTDKEWAKGYSGSYFSSDFNGCASQRLNLAFLAAWVVLTLAFSLAQFLAIAKGVWVPVSFRQRKRGERVFLRFRRVRVQKGERRRESAVGGGFLRAPRKERELRPLLSDEQNTAPESADEEIPSDPRHGLSSRNPFDE